MEDASLYFIVITISLVVLLGVIVYTILYSGKLKRKVKHDIHKIEEKVKTQSIEQENEYNIKIAKLENENTAKYNELSIDFSKAREDENKYINNENKALQDNFNTKLKSIENDYHNKYNSLTSSISRLRDEENKRIEDESNYLKNDYSNKLNSLDTKMSQNYLLSENLKKLKSVEGSINITNVDPGAFIQKTYGTDDNRYGIGQFPNGQLKIYTASGYKPATISFSLAQKNGKFDDVVTIDTNKVTHVNGQLCMGQRCIDEKTFGQILDYPKRFETAQSSIDQNAKQVFEKFDYVNKLVDKQMVMEERLQNQALLLSSRIEAQEIAEKNAAKLALIKEAEAKAEREKRQKERAIQKSAQDLRHKAMQAERERAKEENLALQKIAQQKADLAAQKINELSAQIASQNVAAAAAQKALQEAAAARDKEAAEAAQKQAQIAAQQIAVLASKLEVQKSSQDDALIKVQQAAAQAQAHAAAQIAEQKAYEKQVEQQFAAQLAAQKSSEIAMERQLAAIAAAQKAAQEAAALKAKTGRMDQH
jgi:hypothetical protein